MYSSGPALGPEDVGDCLEAQSEVGIVISPGIAGDPTDRLLGCRRRLPSIAAGTGHNGAGPREDPGGVGGAIWISVGELHLVGESCFFAPMQNRPSRLKKPCIGHTHGIKPGRSSDVEHLSLEILERVIARFLSLCRLRCFCTLRCFCMLSAVGHGFSVPDTKADITSASLMTELRHHPRRLQPLEGGEVVKLDDHRLIGLS